MANNKTECPKDESVEETVETVETAETETDTTEATVNDTLTKEIEELKDAKLRLAAEYDNFRKRSAREKENIYLDAAIATAAKFLPVLDNLERAAKQETADEAYKKGVEMTLNQLYEVMEKLGITEIAALGEQFDPELHNAVLHIEDETVDDNTIVEVFEKGFKMGDRVLRYAIVKVAN